MDGAVVRAFDEASAFFTTTVATVDEQDWNRPGLGAWTVIELVGHANRAHTTTVDYLTSPVPPQALDGPYFTREAIAKRGRESVDALWPDPLAAVGEARERALTLIASTPGNAPLGSPMGETTLEAYLPSRVAELALHTVDLGRALGTELQVPPATLECALAFVAQRSARRGGQVALLALSGRGELPEGYSVF